MSDDKKIHHENIFEEILERVLDAERDIDQINKKVSKIEQQNQQILDMLNEIVPQGAVSSTLTFDGGKMDTTIQVGGTGTATYLEWSGPSGTGSQVPPTGAVQYASDNPAVATVDPNTGVFTGVSAGTANISANDAGLAAPGLPASAVVTVTAAPPPVAVSSTMTLVANSSHASRRA